MLYLDFSATSPVHPEVIDAITTVMKRHYGNPSSLHRLGMEAEQLTRQSRQKIATKLHGQAEEVIFTSGGTEGNNLAILGAALHYQTRGKHIVTVQTEHASVFEAAAYLQRSGFEVTYLPVDAKGQVDVETVMEAIREDTILVSVMHVNNETGAIQPVQEIGRRLINYPKVLFHVDAVQSIGKLPVDVNSLNVDLLTGSAHKFRGPKGTGFLYKRSGVMLHPLLHGGSQEQGIRPGTENVPLLVGMAKALRLAVESQPSSAKSMYTLRRKLVSRLAAIAGVTVTGCQEDEFVESSQAPHIVHFTCAGYKAETVVHALEKQDIFLSTRSACSSKQQKPSRILLAMGMSEGQAESGLRVSYSNEQTEQELMLFADRLEKCLEQLKFA